ncbi:MAG: Sir2 family NAD-dependent protein deacetylase [Thermovirga sp.]
MGVNPERIFDIEWFHKEPGFFYEFHREFLRSLRIIKPTFSHRFFSSLEQKGKMSGIVTQNIDALHQRAGSKNVFEMHGSVWKSFCTNCDREWNYEDSVSLAFSCDVPRCDTCGGVIKPDVVFFGEMVKYLEESRNLARNADLFFVVGSSLNVTPAALLPEMTRGRIVVVNKGEIAYHYLPRERIDIFAEEDIDTFFSAVDTAMHD